MVAAVGCGQKPTVAPQQQETTQDQNDTSAVNAAQPDDSNGSEAAKADNQTNTSQTDKPDQKPKEAEEKKQIIEVYYTDPQEMELKKSEKEIHFKTDADKYKEAFKALQTSGSSELIPLWGKMELKSLYMDGAMTIDIHMPDEARLGAGGEQYALDALSKTMFQFKEVQTIELLVDGQQVESLMGHVDLDHPIKRN
nr:GerMN domain-containing protein [Paenibacillus mangrovi]